MELLIENVLNIGVEEFYRTSRYKVSLIVLLVNSKDKNAFNILDNATRQTDIVQQLSSELIVVFLSHTEYEKSLLFIEKVKKKFDFTYNMSEFKESEVEFIENLFLRNIENFLSSDTLLNSL
ncbi:hypothetical protein HUE87_03140 [Candidatus Sulfurimonas marisnigri]|uniref:Uncharacterized protein n=1 Tax=Candidatus Sulfurimonas marisnigri TaxID=2740405 RepID=A0A7S7M163_9BACT|nr:hypothetical protein [Candidatus Sulfurimonas marisnigri]QOY55247.1 hypothetical protein HUE87_03140 [Candidatus Sulfurimonas marisnigri]